MDIFATGFPLFGTFGHNKKQQHQHQHHNNQPIHNKHRSQSQQEQEDEIIQGIDNKTLLMMLQQQQPKTKTSHTSSGINDNGIEIVKPNKKISSSIENNLQELLQQQQQSIESNTNSVASTSSMSLSSKNITSSKAASAAAPPPDISDFSSKVKLPTVDVINDAFKHLTDFTLVKLLPPDLKTPTQDLPITIRDKVDSVNINLERNIRELMSNENTKGDISDIQNALISIVSRNDAYLLTPEQQNVNRERNTQRLITKIAKPILRFYPHLLQTIRALMAYDVTFKNEVFVEPNHPSAIIYREWMRVLGYLQSIHAVIVFAAKQQLISLEGFPVNLSDFSKYTQSEIDILQSSILKTEEHLSRLRATEIERKKDLNQIASKYKDLDAEISNQESKLTFMQQKHSQLTDPSKLALENISRIQQAYHSII
jgi:hypothetical protein